MPGGQGVFSQPLIGIGSHENYRRTITVRYQSALQIDATHARHPYIGDKAFGISQAAGPQKLLAGRESRCRITERSDERIL